MKTLIIVVTTASRSKYVLLVDGDFNVVVKKSRSDGVGLNPYSLPVSFFAANSDRLDMLVE